MVFDQGLFATKFNQLLFTSHKYFHCWPGRLLNGTKFDQGLFTSAILTLEYYHGTNGTEFDQGFFIIKQ